MSPADFDRRVQAHFDARRDPLDDAEVRTFLAAHPQQLAAYARLSETLRWLPRAMPRPHRHGLSRRWLAIAAAAVAIAVALLGPRARAAAAAPRSAILGAELREIRPRAYAAVQYSLRQPLLLSATTTLEAYEHRSLRR